MVTITLTAFIIIYLVSVIAFYKMVQKQHSTGGEFECINPKIADIFFMLFPVVNTIAIIDNLTKNIDLNATKFFKIKK